MQCQLFNMNRECCRPFGQQKWCINKNSSFFAFQDYQLKFKISNLTRGADGCYWCITFLSYLDTFLLDEYELFSDFISGTQVLHISVTFLLPPMVYLLYVVCNSSGIYEQGFNWESWKKEGGWYNFLRNSIPELASSGITHVWLPPSSHSVSAEGNSK